MCRKLLLAATAVILAGVAPIAALAAPTAAAKPAAAATPAPATAAAPRKATPAERAQADSALKYAGRFCAKYPNNLYALWGLAYCYGAMNQTDSLLRLMQDIPRRFPDDFRGCLLCKDGYSQLFKMTKNAAYKYLSEQSGARAFELNPALVTRTR